MKVNSNAWHARANDYVFGDGYSERSTNLCPYFWSTLGVILIISLVFAVKKINALGIETPSLSVKMQYRIAKIVGWIVFGAILVGAVILGIYNFQLLLLIAGVIGGVAVFMVGVIFGGAWIKEKYDDWRWRHPKGKPKKKNPNIALTFLRAKKSKYCPCLEWTS